MLLDQVVLKDQRLGLGVDDDGVEVVDAAHQLARLQRLRVRPREVRAHPRPQRLRLADVENLTLGVFHQIHAGLRGQVPQLRSDGFRNRHQDLTTSGHISTRIGTRQAPCVPSLRPGPPQSQPAREATHLAEPEQRRDAQIDPAEPAANEHRGQNRVDRREKEAGSPHPTAAPASAAANIRASGPLPAPTCPMRADAASGAGSTTRSRRRSLRRARGRPRRSAIPPRAGGRAPTARA